MMPNSSIIHSFLQSSIEWADCMDSSAISLAISGIFTFLGTGESFECRALPLLYEALSAPGCNFIYLTPIPVTPRSLHQNEDQKEHLACAKQTSRLGFIFCVSNKVFPYSCKKVQDISTPPPPSRNN